MRNCGGRLRRREKGAVTGYAKTTPAGPGGVVLKICKQKSGISLSGIALAAVRIFIAVSGSPVAIAWCR